MGLTTVYVAVKLKWGLGKSRTLSLQSPAIWVLMVDPVSPLEFGQAHILWQFLSKTTLFSGCPLHRVCNLGYNYSIESVT